jgi:hypothetical protein
MKQAALQSCAEDLRLVPFVRSDRRNRSAQMRGVKRTLKKFAPA